MTPLTIAPTSVSPTGTPTGVVQTVHNEPDVDGLFWKQVVTNAGEVIWTKLPRSNVTGYGPIIFVDSPVNVEKWTMNTSHTIK